MQGTKRWVIAIVIAVCLLTTMGLGGCRNAVADKTYHSYMYDTTTNRFVDLDTTLTFTPDMQQFELTYGDTVSLIGSVVPISTGYELQCDGNVLLQVKRAMETLLEDNNDYSDEATTRLKQSFVVQEQIFVYQNCVFSSPSIELIRRVTPDDNRITYTSVEGYYESASDSDCVYLFKDGKVYGTETDSKGNYTKDENGEPKISKTHNATYTIANGLMILTRIDANGKVLLDAEGKPVRLVYLLAAISFPKNIDELVYTDDDYSETIKKTAQLLKGKSVGVLTRSFFTTADMSEFDFNQ